jgi:ATPase subunit of ABC transporter with duplicated ATPase domains
LLAAAAAKSGVFMQALEVEDLSFAWNDARALFSDVSFGISPGFIGLVGANGAGKTTLARLIAGELRPASGRVRFQMDSPSIVVCAQGVDELSPEVVALSEERGARRRYIGLLGLDSAELEHWNELSPGERKRWQLAAALSAEPDVLIVDEPTNHLDAEARAFVVAALARHRGIGVLISHDRELLDRLTTSTLRVGNGTARLYAGSYSRAREQWEADRARVLEVRQTQVVAQKRARAQLEREQRKLEAVRRNLSSKRRMKNPNDHDARGMGAKFRVERAEATISRAVSVKRAELTRTEARVEEFVVDKTLGRSVFVDYEPAPKPRVLSLVKDEIVAGDRVLLRDVRLALGRHEKVRLTGPNGSGKSTLIRALRESSVGDDRICWLPQELTLEECAELRRRIDTLANQERGRLLSLLVALGVDPDHLLASSNPSPGEARKLAIAFGLAEHAYLLVLDEPTNHLDLPSIERLERALAEFPGAILLVSHDAAFAERTTHAAWSIEDGAVNVL